MLILVVGKASTPAFHHYTQRDLWKQVLRKLAELYADEE